MVSILVALVITAQVGLLAANDLIQFQEKKYVKPGDPFDLECSTDDAGIVDAIYGPNEDIPTDDMLREASLGKTENSFTHARGTSGLKFVNASAAKHAGWYTCVVFRKEEPVVVKARCEVIILDLCEDVQCPELKTCVPDYETGTHSCECVFDCPTTGFTINDFICTDHCETMSHECEMMEKNCNDGEDRKVWRTGGFCPFPFNNAPKPIVRQVEGTQLVEPQLGEKVVLDSGIIQDGTPPAQITWTVNSVEREEFKNMRQFTFEATIELWNVECKIVHCGNEEAAIYNRYFVQTELVPPPTSTVPPPNVVPELYPVCSVFPGGAIEQFNSQDAFYDMACSHVLAADFAPNGDYTQSWFIYGTFDKHDGDIALSAMTFYVGRSGFEFQRGWVINNMGQKFEVREGVTRALGDCEITYTGFHLKVACPHFYAYYDGVMSGHIRLGNVDTPASKLEPMKGYSNIGLCWDNRSGFRPNWQVVTPRGCEVDTGLEKCQDVDTCSRFELPPYEVFEMPWAFRGLGAGQSCDELYCNGETATEVQECALIQADNVNLHLRANKELVEKRDISGCFLMLDECDWKKEVMSRGCPQENPPFDC